MGREGKGRGGEEERKRKGREREGEGKGREGTPRKNPGYGPAKVTLGCNIYRVAQKLNDTKLHFARNK